MLDVNRIIQKTIYILYSFNETQKIDLSQINCEICKKVSNNDSYNRGNKFYICFSCNKNMCLLCKTYHDKNHFIIEYDNKNYYCRKHGKTFNKYCSKCKENICLLCENNHNSHELIELNKLLEKINNISKINEQLKNMIIKYIKKN